MPSRHFQVDRFTAYIDSRFNERVYHNDPHEHSPYYELLYFIEGASRIRIDGKDFRAVSGDLVVYYPRVVHEEWVQKGPYRLICLRFHSKDVGRDVPFPGPEHVQTVVHLPWRERFRNLFEQIVIENGSTDRFSAVMRGTYLTQFAVLLWRALSNRQDSEDVGGSEEAARIGTIIDLIHSGMKSDISLADLAGKAFMSASHFSHVFKNVTGVPPKRYLNESRIAKARELLVGSRSTVAGISADLGFSSPQYFSRMFRKQTGMTPQEYRARTSR